MQQLDTHFEVNHCECGHGNDRHAENFISGKGRLCLIPSCSCYSFRLCKEHYQLNPNEAA